MSFRWLPIEGTSTYALYGIDAEKALNTLKDVSISVHCCQGDDVVGFDSREAASGGIQATGDYPGKANTPEELMADYDKAFSLIGGKKKLNLHACYAIFEDGEAAGRDEIEPKHFAKWVEFAKERGMGIDFNPTFFSHPMVKDGLTLSSPDKEVRKYWIKRGVTCLNFEKDNEERLTNIIFEHKYSKPSEELQCSIVTARRYR